jgi:hypothetical protein
MKKLLLLLLVVLVAVCLGGWKWGGSGHKTAGSTWDDSQSVYAWVESTPSNYAADDDPS